MSDATNSSGDAREGSSTPVVTFPRARTSEPPPNNLPLELSSFIGREREMAEVKRLLSDHRLLTLTGPGGCGKTRLALAVAADLVEGFEGGVWLVELASLADPALVPQTVASVLGVREQPGRLLTETLSNHLKPKKTLLVLDNCEHLVEACAELAEALLRACPKLRILTTSREVLGITGETTWRVPSLSLPDPRHVPPIEELPRCEAIGLFIERAAAVLPTFTLTNHNAPAVAQVCHRLDGVPLAIELAAARARVLAVEQIAERLDDCLRLLTAGSRTALPRHRTLRATIDWSYSLL
jgi:predicted ATPase